MKSIHFTLIGGLSILTALSVVSCAPSEQTDLADAARIALGAEEGGTGVGNGSDGLNSIVNAGPQSSSNSMRIYRSTLGFAVKYDEAVDVDESEPKTLRFKNQSLVVQNGGSAEDTSSVTFVLLEGTDFHDHSVTNESSLESFVQAMHPGTLLQSQVYAGAVGRFFETRNAGRLQGTYYFLTNNGQVIRAVVDSNEFADGLEKVAPIVHTFTYDITAPTIHEFKVDGAWTAGTRVSITYRATDDLSGVHSGNCLQLVGPDYGNINTCGSLTALGNDWYSVSFDLSAYVPAGQYRLKHISIEDDADNQASVSYDELTGKYTSYTYGSGVRKSLDIPIFEVTVVNPEGPVDTSAPTIHEFKVDGAWTAGTRVSISYRATDDLSGVHSGNCLQLVGPDYGNINTCGSLTALGNDWYSVSFDLSAYVPAGQYRLKHISIEDDADNQASVSYDELTGKYTSYTYGSGVRKSLDIPIFEVTVVNPEGPVDISAPTIHEFKVDGAWTAGTRVSITYRATDDLSGVHSGSCLQLVGPDYGNINICGSFTALGNDWYSVSFDLSAYVPAGQYRLKHISIEDNADNQASVSYDELTGKYTSYTYGSGVREVLDVPTFTVEVRR